MTRSGLRFAMTPGAERFGEDAARFGEERVPIRLVSLGVGFPDGRPIRPIRHSGRVEDC